jgi:hypothetical protein
VTIVEKAIPTGPSTYRFIQKGLPFTPTYIDLVVCDGIYYDGRTSKKIGTKQDLNTKVKIHLDEDFIDMGGQESGGIITGGRMVLTDLKNVDCLYLGDGLVADIVY